MLSDAFFTKEPINPKWGKKVKDAIAKKEFFLGMTKDQVAVSLGPWEKVNTTVTRKVRHEQVIYENGLYLYFDNGVLTSYQH